MLGTEHAARLTARLAAIAHAADEALVEAAALERVADPGIQHWLPGLVEAIGRIQLDAADALYTARQLKVSLPAPESLQPRLL